MTVASHGVIFQRLISTENIAQHRAAPVRDKWPIDNSPAALNSCQNKVVIPNVIIPMPNHFDDAWRSLFKTVESNAIDMGSNPGNKTAACDAGAVSKPLNANNA